jgi:hypothetical protein
VIPVALLADRVLEAAELVADGSSLIEAIRTLTASLVAHPAIGATSRSRLVIADPAVSTAALARRLAQALSLPSDPATLSALLGAEATEPVGRAAARRYRAGKPAPPLDATSARHVEQATLAIVEHAEGRPGRSIVWSGELLFSADDPDKPAPPFASVIGPSRNILYGPYLHLPPGHYRMELIVAFYGDMDDTPFLFEVHAAQHCLARYRILARAAGGYRGSITFDVANPVPAIEIRLRNERGAIDGAISIVELRLVLVQPASTFS